ncbi:MAG: cell division protein FtsH [Planctomycetota bacterium]
MSGDDEDTLTAYHEAGHAVVGYALGATIEQIQLGGFDDEEDLPRRFGECRVNWGRVDPTADWQLQRELLTTLAGPVAEQVYRGEPVHPALDGPSQGDWAQAWERLREAIPHPEVRTRLLEQLTAALHQVLSRDTWWAAVAAVADELLAHEVLDQELTDETLAFWVAKL